LFSLQSVLQNITVRGHQVLIPGEHAVTLHESDARSAVLVSAEPTGPSVPHVLDLREVLALKIRISTSEALSLLIGHSTISS
jgi:hypothetical protein